jgi:hypothetical protein
MVNNGVVPLSFCVPLLPPPDESAVPAELVPGEPTLVPAAPPLADEWDPPCPPRANAAGAETLTQRAAQRTKGLFMPVLPSNEHWNARRLDAAGSIARGMGTPHLSGTATHSRQETFQDQARRQVALIGGGTSVIGAETAKLFQSEGAMVIVTGSSQRSVETAKAVLPGIEVLVSGGKLCQLLQVSERGNNGRGDDARNKQAQVHMLSPFWSSTKPLEPSMIARRNWLGHRGL